jgi:hypothetical protein
VIGRQFRAEGFVQQPRSEAVAQSRRGRSTCSDSDVTLERKKGRRRPSGRREPISCRWSFRRLWVAAISRHSERHADLPRRWKRPIRRLNFICAKTGSIVALRLT